MHHKRCSVSKTGHIEPRHYLCITNILAFQRFSVPLCPNSIVGPSWWAYTMALLLFTDMVAGIFCTIALSPWKISVFQHLFSVASRVQHLPWIPWHFHPSTLCVLGIRPLVEQICISPGYSIVPSNWDFWRVPWIFKMLLCIVAADQYVVHVNSYSKQVSGDLLHDFLLVSRHRLDSKWQLHL